MDADRTAAAAQSSSASLKVNWTVTVSPGRTHDGASTCIGLICLREAALQARVG
jgi:hypothetical protein